MWGKSCLKTGNFVLAREKFRQAFEKFPRSEVLPGPLLLSPLIPNKPQENPPLLMEILQILLSLSPNVFSESVLNNMRKSRANSITAISNEKKEIPSRKTQSQIEMPLCIQNKLKNLYSVAKGKYSILSDEKERILETGDPRIIKPFMENVFYNECLYYLKTYGSHFGLLKFYLKNGEFNPALFYILHNNISVNIFVECYMYCLKLGIASIFHEYMYEIDNTLNIWVVSHIYDT